VYLVWDEEDRKDIVKVVDFGIAKFTDRSDITSATRTGAVLGTPHFMSPEQARGLKDIDGRADVWSIGVIAYRAVTGALPFDGEAIGDLLVKICTTEPKAPSEHVPVPPAFDAWMQRSLEKDVTKRFANVDEQASALMTLVGADAQDAAGRDLEEQPVSADAVPMLPGPVLGVERERVPTRKTSPFAVAAVVSVIVLGAAAWFVLGGDPASDSVEPTAASAPVEVEDPGVGAPGVELSIPGTDLAGTDLAGTDLVVGAAPGGAAVQGAGRPAGGAAGETGTSADGSTSDGERANPADDPRGAEAPAARPVRKVAPPASQPSHPRRGSPQPRSGGAVEDELGY
jgi:serine/threonine-protein kinase